MLINAARDRIEQAPDNPFKQLGVGLDLAALLKAPPAQSPCAFVYPLAASGKPGQFANVGRQLIIQAFGVAVFVRRHGDATGGAKADDIETMYLFLRSLLIGWEPVGHNPVEFLRGGIEAMGNGAVWWSEEFSTSYHHRSTP